MTEQFKVLPKNLKLKYLLEKTKKTVPTKFLFFIYFVCFTFNVYTSKARIICQFPLKILINKSKPSRVSPKAQIHLSYILKLSNLLISFSPATALTPPVNNGRSQSLQSLHSSHSRYLFVRSYPSVHLHLLLFM